MICVVKDLILLTVKWTKLCLWCFSWKITDCIGDTLGLLKHQILIVCNPLQEIQVSTCGKDYLTGLKTAYLIYLSQWVCVTHHRSDSSMVSLLSVSLCVWLVSSACWTTCHTDRRWTLFLSCESSYAPSDYWGYQNLHTHIHTFSIIQLEDHVQNRAIWEENLDVLWCKLHQIGRWIMFLEYAMWFWPEADKALPFRYII